MCTLDLMMFESGSISAIFQTTVKKVLTQRLVEEKGVSGFEQELIAND